MRNLPIKLSLIGLILYCHASLSGTNPNNLEPVSGEKNIVIENDFTYTKDLGPAHLTYTLKRGQYKATYQSKNGVYYQGPSNCFAEQNEFGSAEKRNYRHYEPHQFNCGIFLNYRKNQKPEIYFYHNPELSKVGSANGVLIKALNESSMKDIRIFEYQPDPEELSKVISFESLKEAE